MKSAVPEGWKTVRLGDVTEVNRYHWNPSDSSPILYLDLTAVVAPGRLSSPRELASINAPSRARRLVRSHDILVSTVRPNLRSFARVRQAPDNLVASTGFAVLTPLPTTDASLIFHHVMAHDFARHLEGAATGQAYPAVRPSDISAYRFALPPLAEQQAIAEVLDSIDEAIERTEAVISATEQFRDSLRCELLSHGLPGWHAEWRDVPGFGTIPAAWKIVRLGDVTAVNRHGWNPTDSSPILYLDLTAVVAPGKLSSPRELASINAPSRARRLVRSHDILVSTVRPNLRSFARVRQAPDNLVASTGFAVLTPLPTTDASLIFHHVMAHDFARHLEGAATGQAYPAVRPSDISAYRIALPPLAEQQAIAEVLDSIDNAIEHHERDREALNEAKESTAEALLTGRLRLPVAARRGHSE